MTQRIRYIDYNYRDNSKISLSSYQSEKTGAKYRIIIDLGDRSQFHIRNERSKEFIHSSPLYKNLNVTKRNARRKLEALGVVLTRESRDRNFGKCEKGYNQQQWEEENLKAN